mgnify:CR=1 FL=1
MAFPVLVIGESGSGKTSSLRNMNKETTFIFQTIKKPLPFKNNKEYKTFVTDDYSKIKSGISKIINNADNKITDIVIDDTQYLMANEFMRRAKEKGFEKFTEIGEHFWDLINFINNIDKPINFYFLGHSEDTELGKTKMKTIGKLLDDKITVEGMFTVVIRSMLRDNQYIFAVKNNGFDTVKTPMGMFETETIENDLVIIKNAMENYF